MPYLPGKYIPGSFAITIFSFKNVSFFEFMYGISCVSKPMLCPKECIKSYLFNLKSHSTICDNDFILADFCFGNCEFTENVDCLKNPTAILCDLYFNCQNDERKRKLMIENLNLFAKYRTAINMKNSEFAIVGDKNSTKTALDFNIPISEQIASQIKEHKQTGIKIKFWVSIKPNGIA